MLTDDQGVLALSAVGDTVKAASKAAVAELKALGVMSIMLTGDNQTTTSLLVVFNGQFSLRGRG